MTQHITHINLAKGFSGGERQTLNLINSLADQGVPQTLIAHRRGQLAREVAALGIPVHTIGHFIHGHWRKGAGELLHCHDGKAVYWAYLHHKLWRVPYVITRRVDNPLSDSGLTRSAYRHANRVVCLSQAIEYAVHERVPEAQTTIIPSSCSTFSVNPARVAEIRSQYPGKILIGQVGKLLKHKGFHVTIEAARILEDHYPNLHFVFLGEGPQREQLTTQLGNLKNVSLLGHKQDIGNWLAALDIMVFPSLSEGLGSTILEAMQHQVPVIGAQAGGIPDIIQDQQTGLLIPPGDAPALAQAITTLLSDPALTAQLTTKATHELQRFTPEAVCQRYLELYQQQIINNASQA